MKSQPCNVTTDSRGREMVRHGTPMFPLACYDEDLRDYSVEWHWHEEFEFILVREGMLKVYVENDRIRLRPGEGIFINSGVLHAAERMGEEPGRYLSAVFHGRLLGGSADSVFWQKTVRPLMKDPELRYLLLKADDSWQKETADCVSHAWEAVAEERDDYENEARYQLTKALGIMNARRPASELHISGQEKRNAERMKVMLQYIEDHYAEELIIADIADSASVSESVCLRCFRGVIGVTPIQYVKQYRIQRASELLLSTNMRSNEIAFRCGFSDISYFTRSFRELTGYTPVEYRRVRTGK